MKAHLETPKEGTIFIGTIRAGKNFHQFGNPFDFVCTVLMINGEYYLCAAQGTFSREVYRAVEKALNEAGITKAHWEKLNIKPRRVDKTSAA